LVVGTPDTTMSSPLRQSSAQRTGHQSMDAQQFQSLNRDMRQLMQEVKRISTDQEMISKRMEEQNHQSEQLQRQRSAMSLNEQQVIH